MDIVDLAPVRQDLPLAEQGIVGRHLLHLGDDLAAVLHVADRIDRLEIMQRGGIDPGLHHGRVAPAVAVGPALGPRPRARRQVPIERLGDIEALGGRKPQRLDVRDHGRQTDQDLAALLQLELRRLLEGIGGVGAAVRERDHVGVRRLRLQQERREIRAVDGMAHRAHDLAAIREHDLAGLVAQVIAERVIGSEEIPGAEPGLHQGGADGVRLRPGVVSPLHRIGPVSYTHLDVYKRQAFTKAVPMAFDCDQVS